MCLTQFSPKQQQRNVWLLFVTYEVMWYGYIYNYLNCSSHVLPPQPNHSIQNTSNRTIRFQLFLHLRIHWAWHTRKLPSTLLTEKPVAWRGLSTKLHTFAKYLFVYEIPENNVMCIELNDLKGFACCLSIPLIAFSPIFICFESRADSEERKNWENARKRWGDRKREREATEREIK